MQAITVFLTATRPASQPAQNDTDRLLIGLSMLYCFGPSLGLLGVIMG